MIRLSLFVFMFLLVIIIFLIWYFGFSWKFVLMIGIVTGVFIASMAISHVYAATPSIEERIEQYKQAHSIQEISRYIFIGDSRTAGMQMSVQSDDVWSCKQSVGYDWMVSEGIPAIEGQITDDTAVFILLGVNDLGNSQAYADYVNNKAKEWTGKTYFVSVGPVGNTTVTNSQIEGFNSIIEDNAISYEYLDLYNSMVADGFGTWDGLHYTPETYQYIYKVLKKM